jgi:hypothetical protein
MAPVSVISHTMPGRTRIRVPDMRGDHEYFEGVQQVLSECPGVEVIETNTMTGSILVHHSGTIDQLKAFGQDRGLFVVQPDRKSPVSITESVGSALTRLDGQLTNLTSKRVNGKEVAFSALLLVGVYQMLRGSIWPAGATLVWYALSILAPQDRRQ